MAPHMLLGTIAYAIAWIAFGAAHSLLAREAPKRLLRRVFGRAARLAWNLVALVQFSLVIAVAWTMVPALAWRGFAVVQVLQVILGVAGVAVLFAAGRSYDMGRFAGITQLRNPGSDDEEPFSARGPLGYVRHPLYAGSILLLLALVHDLRSAETAVFAICYFLIGLRFEERDLLRRLGPEYGAYQARVPALLPWRGRNWPPNAH